MGYRCPVCGHPQSDADHLDNHLAFTALARGGDHEEWLDAHAPDWGDLDPASLGERVTEHAEKAEFPQVFDNTTPDADRDQERHDSARGDLSLEEARELTRRRRENTADGAADDPETE